MAKYNKLTLTALRFLSTNGVDPRQTSCFADILKYIALISNVGVVIIASMEIFLNWNGVSTVAKVEALPNSCLCLSKLLCLIYYKKHLFEILTSLTFFWEADRVHPRCQARISKYQLFTMNFYKVFIQMSAVTVTILSLKPLIVFQRILPFPGYDVCDLQTTPCFEIQVVFQAYHILYQLYLVIMGFDGLFIAFVTYAYAELEMIKYEFSEIFRRDMPQNLVKNRFYALVKHHDFVLRFIKDLNKVYSKVFFVKYWATMISVTFNLFMMTSDGFPPSVGAMVKYCPYIVNLISQLCFYCVAGAYLSSQVVSVSDAAYHNDWWCTTDPKLRKSLTFVITRSQKAERLTVGKMYTLDLITFTQLLRHVVSIYTLMDNLKSKQK